MDDSTPDNVVQLNFGKAQKAVSPLVEQMRSIFEDFLEAGIVAVAFDTRVGSSQVPPQFRGDDHLVLNFAYAYRVPDFGFDDKGIFATLSFPEGYFYCFVPWESILSMHSEALGKSAIWKLPTEPLGGPQLPREPEAKRKSHLSLVKD